MSEITKKNQLPYYVTKTMNNIINKLLKMHLRQSGWTYSKYGPFAKKTKNENKKIR